MKSDINLIFKRKTKTYSNKRILAVVLLIALVAGGMYAGIALPLGAKQVIKLEVAELDSKLSSSTQTQQELTQKAEEKARLSLQYTELNALAETNNDVSRYLKAVETSLPSDANASNISISRDILSICGFAPDDDVIAAFCLRLREQNVFRDVFVSVSTYIADQKTNYFQLEAMLPSSLETEDLIKEIEGKDDVILAVTPAPEEIN